MDSGTFLALFFGQIFRFFSLESPFFGLTFGQIAFGLFVCELGCGIFASVFTGLFDTSAPGAQEKFKKEYSNTVWRNRYIRYHSK